MYKIFGLKKNPQGYIRGFTVILETLFSILSNLGFSKKY